MTGIGFLGAGVIMKEGLSVRGLTTAASIWITSAIGILVGIGFYFPAAMTVTLALGTLSLFRWLESKIQSLQYALFILKFARGSTMSETELHCAGHGLTHLIANLQCRLVDEGEKLHIE
jgi:putative Mg2+ transporter-C (MgtC) family protein